MKNTALLTILCLFLNFEMNLFSQISFIEQSYMLSEQGARSAMPVAISDFDGDFNDDLLILSSGRRLYMEYQRSSHSFQGEFLGSTSGNAEWMVIAGDFDQDGLNEIISGGSYNAVKIFKKNPDNIFELWQITNDDFFAQGSNTVDINNDGWLDLFVCDDDGPSEIWLNDGMGNLIGANDFIDFMTTPPSDNSGNYGSEWIDIDQDNDLDLYIAKCRAGVTDPEDPRRINALFINDGNNNFEEKAAEFGLDINAQSWTTNFDDLDNDGDLDAFIINHNSPFMILENQDGMFVDISSTALVSLISDQGLQSVIRDFDNDGWADILVGGNRDYLLRNNGDLTFETIEEPFGEYEAHTFAVGDLDNDGFLDVYLGHGQNINQIGLVDDALWMNEGNDNEFITVSLLGDSSNINGIGARLSLYGTFGILSRTVRAGEGYGVCHSFNQVFGLGQSNTIDSLVIQWPSGIRDAHMNIEKNKAYIAHESYCLSIRSSLEIRGETTFCEGDSVSLTAPDGYNYIWSSGHTSQSITVKESGNYFAKLLDDDGCVGYTKAIHLKKDIEGDSPIVELALGDTINCAGDLVVLRGQFDQIEWNNGENVSELEVNSEGNYFFSAQGACREVYSDTVNIQFLSIEEPEVLNDTILKGEFAVLKSFSDSTHWFENITDATPIFTGDSLVTSPLEESVSYYARAVSPENFGEYQVGQTQRVGSSLYAGDNINGQIIFSVFREVEIESVEVYTDTPGEREIQILDDSQQVIYSKSFIMETGMSKLTLNAVLQAGEDYVMTTNASLNLDVLGFEGPRLERSKEGTSFPYIIPDLISLNDSNYGPEYFYYFFNWQVKKPAFYCISEPVEVLAVVDSSTGIFEVNTERPSVFPNPVGSYLNIEFHEEIPSQIRIVDIHGRIVNSVGGLKFNNLLDMSDLNSGIYLLVSSFGQKEIFTKIVKK